jgi:hypothetical protein
MEGTIFLPHIYKLSLEVADGLDNIVQTLMIYGTWFMSYALVLIN